MKFKSFTDMGIALGHDIPAPKEEKVRKCPNCKQPLRHVGTTNVWVCDHATMTDEVAKGGKSVQVFTACGTQVIDPA